MKTLTHSLKKKLDKVKEQGYLTLPLLDYQWNEMKKAYHFKEYYSYYINHKSFGMVLRISKYWGGLQVDLSMIDYLTTTMTKKQMSFLLPLELVNDYTGWNYSYQKNDLRLGIRPDRLYISMKNFSQNVDFKASFHFLSDNHPGTLTHENKGEYSNHNTLAIGIPTSGYAILNKQRYNFINSHATLEYNYGHFPPKFSSCRSITQGSLSGHTFALHICHGCCNSISYENTFLYEDVKSKLGRTSFQIETGSSDHSSQPLTRTGDPASMSKNCQCNTVINKDKDYMCDWHISSPCCCFELDFTPLYDVSPIKSIWRTNHFHKVIGKYTGFVILDDGSVIFVHDYYGVAEYVE